MFRTILVIIFFVGLLIPLNTVPAMSEPSISDLPPLGFTQIASGLSLPVSITHAGDSTGRLFTTHRGGEIMIYNGAQVLPTPFLDITSLIAMNGGEQGLLSIAFHPNYSSNGYFYIFYTRKSDGALVIARYHISSDPNIADASSASILLTIPHPGATNHNGGQLQFGPDGYLYISTGDGGTGGGNSQSGSSLLGKILRIDVDNTAPYEIPVDNPFISNAAVADEVWALGLRNPWRFSFDKLTGDLMIADVGQSNWEEVNFQASTSAGGENYGWPCYEGFHTIGNPTSCTLGTITEPILEYSHSLGCSISGGYRYRGEYPFINGVYFYGDFCTGRIWGSETNGTSWVSTELADTDYGISTFGEGEDGSLYVADYFGGKIYKLQASGFSDVPVGYWAEEFIVRLYNAGITGGCSAIPLRYCPEDNVTRAQMAVFLLRGIHGNTYTPPSATGAVFIDVPLGTFADAWIEQLALKGISVGCGNGNFCPDATITRAQMAVFLLRAKYGGLYVPPNATGLVFDDVPQGSFADAWIEQLALEGITSGCGGGNYCPDQTVTRAEMAVFLVRTFNLP